MMQGQSLPENLIGVLLRSILSKVPVRQAFGDRFQLLLLAVVPHAIVISVNEPFDALLWPHAQTVACTYGDDATAFAGCADVLSGRADATGVLPVALGEAAVSS